MNQPAPVNPAPARAASLKKMVVLGVFAFLIAGGGAVWAWDAVLQPRVVAKAFDEVGPGLFRSGQISPHTIGPTLQRHGVGEVVNMGWFNPENAQNQAEVRALERLGVPYHTFNLHGNGTGDPEMYVQGIEAIVNARRQDKTVLVHCWAGTERTSGTVALYQTLVEGKSDRDAMTYLLQFHNPRRNTELLPFLNEHVGHIAQQLLERGVIDSVPQPLPAFVVP